MNNNKKNFEITMRKGFHITFENGITASVQWGVGNYCENHMPHHVDELDFIQKNDAVSDTAEVSCWDKSNEFILDKIDPEYSLEGDGSVAGYLTPEQVLHFLNLCASYKDDGLSDGDQSADFLNDQ